MTSRDIESGVHKELKEVSDGASDEDNNQLLDESQQVERKPFDMEELGAPNLSINESSHMMMTDGEKSIDNQIEMAVVANQVANQMLDDSMQSGPKKGFQDKKLSASGQQSDAYTDAITES